MTDVRPHLEAAQDALRFIEDNCLEDVQNPANIKEAEYLVSVVLQNVDDE